MKEASEVIRQRHSMRGPFDPNRSVAKKDLRHILEAGRWAPTAHNMQNFELIVVEDKGRLKALANIPLRITETFVKENYENLSFSEEELARKKVGLLGTLFPPALRIPGAKLDKVTHDELISWWRKLIQSGPVLIVVTYDPRKRAPDSPADFLGIISLGCALENMWLMANALGISFHLMSILGEDAVQKEVKRILDIPEYLKVAFAFRLGYPIGSPPSALRVRRDLRDFVYSNRFGDIWREEP